jgi:hypothetical protein
MVPGYRHDGDQRVVGLALWALVLREASDDGLAAPRLRGAGVPCPACNTGSPPRLPADWESKARVKGLVRTSRLAGPW